jgi:hypothetical protein
LPGSGILEDCLTSWEGIAYLNQVIGDMQHSLDLLMVKLQEQEAESKKLSSDFTKINAKSTKSISELQSDLQTIMDIMKVLNEEHELLVNHIQGTSSPSTATIVSYQDDMDRLANRLAMCENTLGQSHHSSSSDTDIRSEVAQLKNLIKAVDLKIPKFSTMQLGGKLYQSKNDVELFVASSMPSNAFHHFHDAVTILESLSSSFTERKDVLAEMYQSAKVGVSAQEAKHIASFKTTLPYVFGAKSENATSKHKLPGVKSFDEWTVFDQDSGVMNFILKSMEDFKIQALEDINAELDMGTYPDANKLASEMYMASHYFICQMCTFITEFVMEMKNTVESTTEEG